MNLAMPLLAGLKLAPVPAGAQVRSEAGHPPPLKQNDLVGITCAGGFASREDVAAAKAKFEEWGFAVQLGETIGKRDFSFGGTDEERRADIQRMIDDPSIKAIIFSRGGYGAARIIDQLDFSKFLSSPKWIIGFSDATVFHCHLNSRYKLATLHSKMCNSFPADWNAAEPVQRECINFIRDCLVGEKMNYKLAANPVNRQGRAVGRLVGGNLRTIENMAGTRSELDAADAILFIEDTGEYLYGIDRMLGNLRRSGKLAGLKGLIVGGFRIKADDEGEEFGRTLQQIVFEKLSRQDFPVCFDFPIGHQKNNVPVKCGILHELNVTASGVILKEL